MRSGRRTLSPAEVALGAHGEPAAAVPFTAEAAALAVSVEQATALLATGGRGARLWYVPRLPPPARPSSTPSSRPVCAPSATSASCPFD